MPAEQDTPQSYTVIVRGETFTLSEAQIRAAPGSLFERSLLGDFAEGQSRTLRLDRTAHVFRMVVDHLSGYDVFPVAGEDLAASGLGHTKFLS